ncbi:hypothetical protein IGI04_043100 [Brassica rapa subsp. trilocularis]|uniref:Uncharacterized protein n=1 Tax=Brassica rapa subsp. trilocularis TaxID=1813537 RepID=A0ABQ7KK96_BRACM|nr:hypothetical protein IGI04_043100 [Brassica rapa subsp. trilocularis]
MFIDPLTSIFPTTLEITNRKRTVCVRQHHRTSVAVTVSNTQDVPAVQSVHRIRTLRGLVRDSVQHTQDVRGCSVWGFRCVPSVHTRTSVSNTQDVRAQTANVPRQHNAGRPWLSVCPSAHADVPQYTQDVRQHTKEVRQHRRDVRGCPCVAVCTVQYTQDVPQDTQDGPTAQTHRTSVGRPSVHTGRP